MSPSLRIFFAMYKTSPAHCSIANGIGFAQQQATNQHATMLSEPRNVSNVKNVEKYKPRLLFWKIIRCCFLPKEHVSQQLARPIPCVVCVGVITFIGYLAVVTEFFRTSHATKKLDATGKLMPAAPTRMASPPPPSPCEFVTPKRNNSVEYFLAFTPREVFRNGP